MLLVQRAPFFFLNKSTTRHLVARPSLPASTSRFFHATSSSPSGHEQPPEPPRETRIDTWPDGTPKQYQGKDAWKNWINYDTDHHNLTDELNRLRHFFWEVDDRGKLWRLEIDALDENGNVVGAAPERCGQMKEAKILDFFFPRVQRNQSNMYTNAFPFVVQRAHEMYFCRTTWHTPFASASGASDVAQDQDQDQDHSSYPIVFNNFIPPNSSTSNTTTPQLQYSCPSSGHVVHRLDTFFDPSTLRTDVHGRLFHPIDNYTKVSTSGKVKQINGTQEEVRWGLLDSVLAQTIAAELGDMRFDEETKEMSLVWEGTSYPVVSD